MGRHNIKVERNSKLKKADTLEEEEEVMGGQLSQQLQ